LIGYRHIGLRNEFNLPQGVATVFVHIQVKDYIMDAFAGNFCQFVDFFLCSSVFLLSVDDRDFHQCFHDVGWVTGMAKKRVTFRQGSTVPERDQEETLWKRLTQVYLENTHLNDSAVNW